MKTASLVVLGALLVPAIATAQPSARPVGPVPAYGYQQQYQPPPPPPPIPGGFHDRTGRFSLGFSLGFGKMTIDDSDVACDGCDGDPLSFSGDAHLGWMMSPRLALMFEVQGAAQTIADNAAFTETLVQSTAMVGAQYWVTPQLWIKGGIGAAALQVQHDEAFTTSQSDTLEGGAIMGAVGYEVLSARRFAVDIHLQAIGATYQDSTTNADGSTSDTNVGTTSLGVGFNWY